MLLRVTKITNLGIIYFNFPDRDNRYPRAGCMDDMKLPINWSFREVLERSCLGFSWDVTENYKWCNILLKYKYFPWQWLVLSFRNIISYCSLSVSLCLSPSLSLFSPPSLYLSIPLLPCDATGWRGAVGWLSCAVRGGGYFSKWDRSFRDETRRKFCHVRFPVQDLRDETKQTKHFFLNIQLYCHREEANPNVVKTQCIRFLV